MSTRERTREDEARRTVIRPGASSGGVNHRQLDSTLNDAYELLNESDRAISQVVSTDSDTFNKQATQATGE